MNTKIKPNNKVATPPGLAIPALRAAYSMAIAERAALAEQLPTLAGRAVLNRNGIDELKASKQRLAELDETIAGLEHSIKTAELAEVAAQRAATRAEQQQADEETTGLIATVEGIEGEIAELAARLSANAGEAEALTAQKPALAAAGLVGGDAEARAQLDSINEQLAQLDDIRMGIEHTIGQKRAELEAAKARVENARKEAAGHTYEVARVRLAEARELFEKRISEAGEALDKLVAELGTANSAAATIGSFVEPWHAVSGELEAFLAKTLGRHRGPHFLDLGDAEREWIYLQARKKN